MRILVAGASGFLGTALCDHLAAAGHEVHRLVRREPQGPSEHRWDPDQESVDVDLVRSMDAVVNLAGAPIGRWPWSATWRRNILQSRVRTTGTLARAVAACSPPPALVVASGTARHGHDRGAEWLDESSSDGPGFLADVVRAWEAAADPAREAGARVVHLRSGVVADRRGGALKAMLPAFRLGVGARLGSGRQYFSMISLRDWVAATRHLLEHPDCEGPFYLVGLDPPTNAELTAGLAARLHRPALLAVPAWPMRLVLGELSGELLGSLRVRPTRLVESGFEHRDRTADDVLDAALSP